MYATYFNRSDAPFVLEGGSMIPGRSWAPARTDDVRVVAGVVRHTLVLTERPRRGVDVDPRAAAALARTDELNKPAKPEKEDE